MPVTEKKIKILAVDDNQSNLIAMESVFYGTPYEIIEARSGAAALALLHVHEDISLILLDVQMPDMDGYETAKKIKELSGCQDIPIIFITAYYREEPYVRKGYAAGAVDYFGKPFDPELLRLKADIYSSFRQKSFLLKEREERVRETEELLKAGRKLSHIFEQLAVGVLISDRDGKIFQCNHLASRLLNADEAENSDRYGEILGWWDQNGSMLKLPDSPMWKALHSGKSTHNKPIEIRCLDGNLKSLLASASPLVESSGQISGAVIILQDISQTKEVEEDFEEKVSKLVTANVELEHSLSKVIKPSTT